MARNTIQIPIIKSSNNNQRIWVNFDSNNYFIPPAVSNSLYVSHANNSAVGWNNSLMPKNKAIVSVKLFLYFKSSFSRYLYYRAAEFGEGGGVPSVNPADGSLGGSFSSGWNSFNLDPELISGISSVIIGTVDSFYNGYLEMNSHRNSSNKPYIEVVYDDIPPDRPSSLYPDNITASTRDVIRFAWMHNSKEDNEQKGFSLQYSTNGGSTWTTVNQTTPNQYYDMPANTLPTTGTVTWRVSTTDGNGEVSEYATTSFTLGIVPQKAPIPISPISQYLDENKAIRFEWSFVGGAGGETQSKFDLQYSINVGSSWTTKTLSTSNKHYEVPANTFSGGNITWRIRTYNNWNEVSPYSENRSFTVIGSPAIPLISSVTNSGRPIISWQSTQQHIYELQILKGTEVIFDAGSIPSTSDRSFMVPIYLEDGNYIAKLRIYNEYNLFSEWSEKNFAISTVKPIKPETQVFGGEYSVTIKASSTSSKNLVYRDNVLLGSLIGNTFIDYTGKNNKEYKYHIRAIDNNDNFADSEIKLARCKFGGSTLALADIPTDFIKLKYGLNSNPTKSNQFNVIATLQNYDGREYPVAEYSEFSNRSKSLTFYLQTREDLLKFIDMIKQRKTLLYRNRDGDNIHGTILSVDFDENETFWGYEISFTITQTVYKGAAYD